MVFVINSVIILTDNKMTAIDKSFLVIETSMISIRTDRNAGVISQTTAHTELKNIRLNCTFCPRIS